MGNPSMFGSDKGWGSFIGIGEKESGASKLFGGSKAMLIPALIGMGLNLFSSRKAANKLEDMANQWMSAALMRESKYTERMETFLDNQKQKYDWLFSSVYGSEGMPENPSYDITTEKEYGFTNTEREITTGSRPRR